jgi:hypothetical protein
MVSIESTPVFGPRAEMFDEFSFDMVRPGVEDRGSQREGG